MQDEILSIVFPNRCAYCGELIRPEEKICLSCKTSLPKIDRRHCLYCGHSLDDCICRHKKNEFKGILSPFYYEAGVKKAVHRLKFKGVETVADTLAEDIANAILDSTYQTIDFDFITFVPITKRQQKTRVYNQSEALATCLAERLQVPCQSTLIKLYDIAPQHTLRRKDRLGNVFGVFDVREPEMIRGKTILLVDDVKTTGATMSECAKMLNLADAKAVYAVSAAITKNK